MTINPFEEGSHVGPCIDAVLQLMSDLRCSRLTGVPRAFDVLEYDAVCHMYPFNKAKPMILEQAELGHPFNLGPLIPSLRLHEKQD